MAIFMLCLPSACMKRPASSVSLDDVGRTDPERIYQQILDRSGRVRTLRGTAHLRLRSEQQKASLDVVIACDREGRLRFEILDWLNHVVFLAVFDSGGFLTYSASENEYRVGPEEAEEFEELLGMPVTAGELTTLALGDPFFMPLSDPAVRASVDRNALLLDVEGAGAGPRYLIWLGEKKRPERMVAIDGEAARNLEVDYDRYREVDGVLFPHRIRVSPSGSERELQIDFQRVLLNEPLPEDLFRFAPPAGAARVGD